MFFFLPSDQPIYDCDDTMSTTTAKTPPLTSYKTEETSLHATIKPIKICFSACYSMHFSTHFNANISKC